MDDAKPAPVFETEPCAWLVIAADGFRMPFLHRKRADSYAANCGGVVHPLHKLENPDDPDATA